MFYLLTIADCVYQAVDTSLHFIYYKWINPTTDIEEKLIDASDNLYPENTFDRFVYYGMLSIILNTLNVTGILSLNNNDRLQFIILLLHAPWIFNYYLYPLFSSFFKRYKQERREIYLFCLYKQLLNNINNALQSKNDIPRDELTSEILNDYIQTYISIQGILMVREHKYILYKIFKWLYYYDTGYLIHNEKSCNESQSYLTSIIQQKKWNLLSTPRCIHAIIYLSKKNRVHEKRIRTFYTFLIIWSACWTFTDIGGIIGMVITSCLFYHYTVWYWIFVGCFIHYLSGSALLGTFVVAVNEHWIINPISQSIIEFVTMKYRHWKEVDNYGYVM